MSKNNPPSITETAFECPHCGAYTTQFWFKVYANAQDKNALPLLPNKDSMKHVLENKDEHEEVKQRLINWIDRITLGKTHTKSVTGQKLRFCQ